MGDLLIDSKFKKIYSKSVAYRELSDMGKHLFDSYFFPILWFNKTMNYSNKVISEKVGYSVSTIEKKLRELERKELIIRDMFRYMDYEKGVWITQRTISLDPGIIKMICVELGIPGKVESEFKKSHLDSLVEERKKMDNPKMNIPPTSSKEYVNKKKDNDITEGIGRRKWN